MLLHRIDLIPACLNCIQLLRLWLPWGKHINLAYRPNDIDMIVRPYTPTKPVLAQEDNGTFEVVFKVYFATGTYQYICSLKRYMDATSCVLGRIMRVYGSTRCGYQATLLSVLV